MLVENGACLLCGEGGMVNPREQVLDEMLSLTFGEHDELLAAAFGAYLLDSREPHLR